MTCHHSWSSLQFFVILIIVLMYWNTRAESLKELKDEYWVVNFMRLLIDSIEPLYHVIMFKLSSEKTFLCIYSRPHYKRLTWLQINLTEPRRFCWSILSHLGNAIVVLKFIKSDGFLQETILQMV